jgi:hypothetical protein
VPGAIGLAFFVILVPVGLTIWAQRGGDPLLVGPATIR